MTQSQMRFQEQQYLWLPQACLWDLGPTSHRKACAASSPATPDKRHPVQRYARVSGKTDRRGDLAGEPPPAQRRQIVSDGSGIPSSCEIGLKGFPVRNA